MFWKSPKKIPKSPKRNVNQALTWLVGGTIYCTIFQKQFISITAVFAWQNYLEKKLAWGNNHWTNYWISIEGSGPPCRTCTPMTGYFHGKTKIFKKNLWVDYYLQLKYCRRQCTLLSLPGLISLQTLTPKCKILNVFWTKIASKWRINQIKIFNWFSNVKKSSFLKWL